MTAMENKRQRRIQEILTDQGGWMTGRQLAALLQVSDRTIRSDVRDINGRQPYLIIESNVQFGYRMIPGRRKIAVHSLNESGGRKEQDRASEGRAAVSFGQFSGQTEGMCSPGQEDGMRFSEQPGRMQLPGQLYETPFPGQPGRVQPSGQPGETQLSDLLPQASKSDTLWTSKSFDSEESGSVIPQTAGARCVYIIQKLLFESRGLNLTILQSQLYVSGYSLDHDMKRIRKMLEPYANLKLVRSREQISLQGDELSKRKFYKDLLVAEVQKNFLNLNQLAALYKKFDLLEVKNILEQVIKSYDYSIRDAMMPMVMLHAGTSIERMMHSDYITLEETAGNLTETIEYQISSDFFRRISDRLHIKVTDSEISRFAIIIMGRRAADYTNDFIRFRGTWINTARLTDDVLNYVKETFGIDFRSDEDLKAGLKLHLHGLLEREQNQLRLDTVFLEEIKRKYPLVFEMGIVITEFLEKVLGVEISDVESGFIAIHLGAASERMNAGRKYRAVAILPYNQSFSKMCVTKMSEMFREKMEIVAAMHYFEKVAVEALEPDLILTAFPIIHSLDVPTVLINLFVDLDTETNILKALNQLEKKAFHLEFTSHIGNLIRREYYYEDLDCSSAEEIIRFLCRDMERGGLIDSTFCDVVLKRERMSPTSFVDTFAIPHAFGSFARISTIAVAQLKNPVRWGSFDVRLVMLFAVNEEDQRMIKIFFDWVSDLVNHMNKLAGLCEPCGYEGFIDRVMD